jgi:hypothetical protein
MTSLHHQQLERLVGTHGTLSEQQLIQRWRAELEAFLQPAERQLLNRALGLEIGIEDTLSLKLTLKSHSLGAVPTLLAMMQSSPIHARWGEYILQHNLRFHCGIKLTPDRFSKEIYAYPKEYSAIQDILGDTLFADAAKRIIPLGIGIDDQRGYSMYFDARETTWVDTLRMELGLADWHGAKLWAWQQARYDGEKLLPGKTALELTPLPLPVLARCISHYPFPFFRYLIPMQTCRSGNFGRDPVSGRFALYATVN